LFSVVLRAKAEDPLNAVIGDESRIAPVTGTRNLRKQLRAWLGNNSRL